MTEISLTDQEWEEAGDITDGYSGSDLINVVMAACCERLQQMKNCKHWIASGWYYKLSYKKKNFDFFSGVI